MMPTFPYELYFYQPSPSQVVCINVDNSHLLAVQTPLVGLDGQVFCASNMKAAAECFCVVLVTCNHLRHFCR